MVDLSNIQSTRTFHENLEIWAMYWQSFFYTLVVQLKVAPMRIYFDCLSLSLEQ